MAYSVVYGAQYHAEDCPWVKALEASEPDAHDCEANAVPYIGDGPLGHGWECGVCGEFLQAG